MGQLKPSSSHKNLANLVYRVSVFSTADLYSFLFSLTDKKLNKPTQKMPKLSRCLFHHILLNILQMCRLYCWSPEQQSVKSEKNWWDFISFIMTSIIFCGSSISHNNGVQVQCYKRRSRSDHRWNIPKKARYRFSYMISVKFLKHDDSLTISKCDVLIQNEKLYLHC